MELYTPLDHPNGERIIRLLTLLPRSAVHDDDIQCILEPIDLDSSPEYEALSYCWGPVIPEYIIRCNAVEVVVYGNLYGALQQLILDDEPRQLWVDALCIDQSNNLEKNYQIPMMRDIYEKAQKTIIWLGDSAPSIDIAMPYLPLLVAMQAQRLQAGDEREWKLLSSSDWEHYGMPNFDEISLDFFKALSPLWSCAWFSRAWIIQELAVSTNCEVWCGVYHIDWPDFRAVQSLILSLGFHRNFIGDINSFTTFWSLARIRDSCQSGHRRPLIDYLLLQAHMSDATDPRDKIYALCGLASDVGPSDLAIDMDYNKSKVDVYVDFAASYLRRYRDFRILEAFYGGSASKVPGLPSWCPDWSVNEVPLVPLRPLVGEGGELDGQYDYHSTNHCQPRFTISENNRELMVRVVRVDTVQNLGSVKSLTMPSEWSTEAISTVEIEKSDLYQEWAAVSGMKQNPVYQTGEKTIDAFAYTLVAGHAQDPLMLSCFHKWWNRYRVINRAKHLVPSSFHGPNTALNIIIGSNILYSLVSGVGSLVFPDGASEGIFDKLSAVANNRRLIRSGRGLIALVPRNTERGDWIMLLEGAKAPFILRQSANAGAWQLVGEAYVHGIMKGEAFSQEKLESITIV